MSFRAAVENIQMLANTTMGNLTAVRGQMERIGATAIIENAADLWQLLEGADRPEIYLPVTANHGGWAIGTPAQASRIRPILTSSYVV